jgi:hypothetical protein
MTSNPVLIIETYRLACLGDVGVVQDPTDNVV